MKNYIINTKTNQYRAIAISYINCIDTNKINPSLVRLIEY